MKLFLLPKLFLVKSFNRKNVDKITSGANKFNVRVLTHNRESCLLFQYLCSSYYSFLNNFSFVLKDVADPFNKSTEFFKYSITLFKQLVELFSLERKPKAWSRV